MIRWIIKNNLVSNNITFINTNRFSEIYSQCKWNNFRNIIILAGIRFDCNIYTKRHNYLYSSTGRDGGESNSIVKSKSIFRKICKTA